MSNNASSIITTPIIKYCKKNNCTNVPIPRGKYCETHRTMKKRCIVEKCKNSSQGKTDKCKSHGGGARCTELGCNTSAIGSTQKCKIHGGGKRCIVKNCSKSVAERSDKCKLHGGGIRCVVLGCTKSAQGTTDKCKSHGGGARCVEPKCKRSARGASDKCSKHGGGPRCIVVGCSNGAQGMTNKCKTHNGGIRCSTTGCKKSAQGKIDKCKEHGGGLRCPNCINWIDSRCGNKNYDGYCITCFKRIFPNDPRSIVTYNRSKELRVRNALIEHFTGFIHDIPLYTGGCDCTHRRRIDHRILIGNTILAVETDEFAHRGYDKHDEEIRYDDVYMIHSGKWIWIRFNPDKTQMCSVDFEDRITVLLDEIEAQIQRIEIEDNKDLVEIVKLFY